MLNTVFEGGGEDNGGASSLTRGENSVFESDSQVSNCYYAYCLGH